MLSRVRVAEQDRLRRVGRATRASDPRVGGPIVANDLALWLGCSPRDGPATSPCAVGRLGAERFLAGSTTITRGVLSGDEVRLRLHRGQQGPEGPARRQGRQPRRDDQPRPAGAARLHDHHRGLQGLPRQRRRARRAARRGQRRTSTALEQAMGKRLGEADDPLLVSRALRREVLDARDDGDGPQHRPQRRVGAGPGQAGRQRAVRLGLLPPADPDVRQDRARHRRRALRGRPRRGQEGQGHRRTTSTSTTTTCSSSSTRSRASSASTPAASSRRTRASRWTSPSAPSSTRGTPTARDALPPPGAHPGRPRHRGQRLLDGLRQPRHGLRHRRRLHPRPRHRRTRASTATTCRTRRARTSSPASATPCRCRTSRASTSRRTTSCMAIMATLENHYRDLCDIEFTIERGKLWMLQTRVGKRTAAAAFRIATQLVDEGLIDMDEALHAGHRRPARAADVPALRRRRRRRKQIAKGMDASPGRGGRQGRLRLRHAPSKWSRTGEKVILVRRETNPDDLDGMIAAQGILTSRGGKTSPRRRRRPRHGQDLRLRRRGARGRHQGAGSSRRPDGIDGRGGRRHLHRRHHRRGLPRRGAGRALPGRASTSRATLDAAPTTPTSWSRPCTGSWRTPTSARRLRRARQRRHPRGRRAGPPLRRRRASACAAPSTCSSATAASSSSG